MEPLTLAAWRSNPELRQKLIRAAHRERNEQIGRLLAQLYRWLKSAHAARPDLASQG